MKVFSYSKNAAKKGRPRWRNFLKRMFYNAEQGKDKAFLLSEKGRLYLVEGRGVLAIAPEEMERLAFEKYAPMRDLRVRMLVAVRNLRRRYVGAVLELEGDFYDYHEKTLLRGRRLRVARVYEDFSQLEQALTEFDNEAVNLERLQVNKDFQARRDKEEYAKLHAAVATEVFLLAFALVLGIFMAKVFFLLIPIFAIVGLVAFGKILRSPFATEKKTAYMAMSLMVGLVAGLCLVVMTGMA